jgi:hypothetical protein
MSSRSTDDAFASIDEADRAWAQLATADANRRHLLWKIIRRVRVEIASIERSGLRGNTTLKICHPEGVVRKAFLNDRQV